MEKFEILMFAIVMIGGFLLLIYMHELVHVEIYKKYDIESKIGIKFPNAVTIVNKTEFDLKCTENCKLANNINEAITYPLTAFYVMIGLGILLLLGNTDYRNNRYFIIDERLEDGK